MLPMNYINKLIETKLEDLIHQSDRLSPHKAGVSLAKEGEKALLFHQPTHPVYPSTVFIYNKEQDWTLAYYLHIEAPEEFVDYHIDAWLDPSIEGFVIRLSDQDESITYRYALKDDTYKLAVTFKNTQPPRAEQAYFLEGAF